MSLPIAPESQQFLDAWKEAGHPSVERTTYPTFGKSETVVYHTRSMIFGYAYHDPRIKGLRFKDDGSTVSLDQPLSRNRYRPLGGTLRLSFSRSKS